VVGEGGGVRYKKEISTLRPHLTSGSGFFTGINDSVKLKGITFLSFWFAYHLKTGKYFGISAILSN
jgi:hypothetical protein